MKLKQITVPIENSHDRAIEVLKAQEAVLMDSNALNGLHAAA